MYTKPKKNLYESMHRFIQEKKSPINIVSLPIQPFNIFPTNNSIHIRLDQIISWRCDNQAQFYNVYIGPSIGALVLVSSHQYATMYIPILAWDQTIVVRIDAGNTLGTTQGTPITFNTWSYNDIVTDDEGYPRTDDEGNYIEVSKDA